MAETQFIGQLPTIALQSVQVNFPIYFGGSRSLKKSLLFKSSAGRIARDAGHLLIEALRDITLTLKPGDRVALIGANGAGKTTLLRVLAGIYEPTSGHAKISGRISPMFDIGLGIDAELSGYENIRLRGLILGLSPKEIDAKLADIAEFTELGDYLHMPVRTYSSGMMLRLTFAVSTCFDPEIVLMDEWILAGDANFLQKAHNRLATFVGRASIFVLASHNLDLCAKWCTHGLWMEQGHTKMYGKVEDVIAAYTAAVNR
jgi:ABC-type polysaccharide/polyol phosphate transport system ATPase subunit